MSHTHTHRALDEGGKTNDFFLRLESDNVSVQITWQVHLDRNVSISLLFDLLSRVWKDKGKVGSSAALGKSWRPIDCSCGESNGGHGQSGGKQRRWRLWRDAGWRRKSRRWCERAAVSVRVQDGRPHAYTTSTKSTNQMMGYLKSITEVAPSCRRTRSIHQTTTCAITQPPPPPPPPLVWEEGGTGDTKKNKSRSIWNGAEKGGKNCCVFTTSCPSTYWLIYGPLHLDQQQASPQNALTAVAICWHSRFLITQLSSHTRTIKQFPEPLFSLGVYP